MRSLDTLWGMAAAALLLTAVGCPDPGEGTGSPSPGESTPSGPPVTDAPSGTPTGTDSMTQAPTATGTATATPSPSPTLWPDDDGDGARADEDCDDGDPQNAPGLTEACDGQDNDCDLAADEGVTTTWYLDDDGDGYGDPNQPQGACEAPEGFVASDADCDDGDASAFPGGEEVCDGADNDCDATADEGVDTLYYADQDEDGAGDDTTTRGACAPPEGFVLSGGDCDDADPLNFSGNPEVCDGGDNDCDQAADEGVATAYYADADGDTFGNPDMATFACALPEGLVEDGQDCDDLDPDQHPGVDEVCNGEDDDCDRSTDEGLRSPFYGDGDGDGYGALETSIEACTAPEGFTGEGGDCDDDDPAIHPGAEEICDDTDQDCDEALIPCTAAIDFEDAGDRGLFTLEENGCTEDGVVDGGLEISCPDNRDAVYWLNFTLPEAAVIEASVDLYVSSWRDTGPRCGLDFGEGFTAWGPPEGYAFHMSDPEDETQGSACHFADSCPSITLNAHQMATVVDVQTSPDQTYHLEITLDADGEAYDLTFPFGEEGASTYTLAIDDGQTRAGRIGLHCSESDCRFDHLQLRVE